MLPLFLMLAGAVSAVSLLQGHQDLLAIVGATCGFGLGVATVRWHAWIHREDSSLLPTLLEILKPGSVLANAV